MGKQAITTTRRSLRYTFTENEAKELARELANKNQEQRQLEEQKKSVVAEYGSRLTVVKEGISLLSDKVASGYEMRDVQQTIKKFFPAAVTIFGDDDMATRQRNVDAFQKDPKVQLIICSIKAAGVGITLTASSRVAFVELPWHPADCEQCEDRAHRIGQMDSVHCSYFLGKDTIDEDIYKLIAEKRSMSNQITGARNEVEENIINGVINILSNK